MLERLDRFFAANELANRGWADYRYGDPHYLAARFVVWLASQERGAGGLDFLGVGVGECWAHYTYRLACTSEARPRVTHGKWKEEQIG